MTLKSYLNFNYIHAGILALLLFALLCVQLQCSNQRQGQAALKKEILWRTVLALYITLLISGTLLGREPGEEYQAKWLPFWSYREYAAERNTALLLQIIHNVLVFIPWPMLYSLVFPRMRRFWLCVGSALGFSVLIEITQLVWKLGLFEFDDMFHNTLGAVIGYVIVWRVKYRLKRRGQQ